MSTSPNQRSLFDKGVLPWDLPSGEMKAEFDRERAALLKALADSLLGTIEQRVVQILHRFPETRDSATALAVRYWRTFQADVLETATPFELEVLFDLENFETISRFKRHLQNDLGLFRGTPFGEERRSAWQMDFSRYLAEKSEAQGEIRLYLDETGNEPQARFTGVGGICVLDWGQYEKHYAALLLWRDRQKWPATLHFADAGEQNHPKCLALLGELGRRRSGLLFVGHSVLSRGWTQRNLLTLFVQLAVDSIKKMRELGCLESSRSLVLVKERDDGFDNVYAGQLDRELAQQLAVESMGTVFLKQVLSLPKGREVLLECADLIAGGMQRRALHGGRNPKDTLAEAVMNVTGFEDPREEGVVFKAW